MYRDAIEKLLRWKQDSNRKPEKPMNSKGI